jgi:hypothetical protein
MQILQISGASMKATKQAAERNMSTIRNFARSHPGYRTNPKGIESFLNNEMRTFSFGGGGQAAPKTQPQTTPQPQAAPAPGGLNKIQQELLRRQGGK